MKYNFLSFNFFFSLSTCLKPLARLGATVTGIDASKNMIDIAISHACQDPVVADHITYHCQTVEEHMNEYKNHYDAVVASEVLEHVAQKELFLGASVAALKVSES